MSLALCSLLSLPTAWVNSREGSAQEEGPWESLRRDKEGTQSKLADLSVLATAFSYFSHLRLEKEKPWPSALSHLVSRATTAEVMALSPL